ncbi:hypothetical protein [Mucilaginibacter flavidus]|uniref:hypothetical protein n=1 Tax=Mucilaginibacter flavidus TaxID=2949309 RepID=UPI0020934BB6|nr:hypothetical protein [Mucilaginibacter flavidus]MCO5950546.1 hypothetical protein [Mucilaginibacter flavidus]
MKKILTVIIISFSIVSCRESFYYLKLPTSYNGHKFVYKLKIPQKFVLMSYHPKTGEASETENSAHLADGTTIYITDNISSGSNYNEQKIAKYGENFGMLNYRLNDTATLYGVYNGRYWKEKKYPLVVVGYYNVDGNDVKSYDKLLNDIAMQVDSLKRIGGK